MPASTFTIKELTVPKRVVNLTGRALPYRPYKLSGTMRVETTWYPGNPEATVQILGSAEDPTTLNGMWKDVFLKNIPGQASAPFATINGNPIADVLDLVTQIDEIRRMGQLLEVTWDETTRVGHLTSFEQTWLRREDMEWSMTFTWISQGDTPGPPIIAQPVSLGDLREAFQSALQDNARLAANAPFLVQNKILGPLAGALRTAQAGVNAIRDTVAGAVTGALDAVSTARRAAGVMDTMIATGQATVQALAQKPFSAMMQGVPTLSATIGETLATAQWARTVAFNQKEIGREAAERRNTLLNNVDGQVLTPYRMRENEDLRTVALKFYGNAESWRQIATFNGLPNAEPTPGRIIFIPRPQN